MRIAHLSDLHFGRHDQKLADGLAAELDANSPDIVVISGDFTQDGTEDEFEAASAFLEKFRAPVIAVPGNHDVPAKNLLRRFFSPYGLYRKHIARDIEPFLEHLGVAFAGINTARRMRLELNWSHGSIGRDQLRELEETFAQAHPEAVRVVIAHHPLLQPEAVGEVPMRTVGRADLALATFARLGVRLVLSGHFHLSYVREHVHQPAVREGAPSGVRRAAGSPILVAQASSTISDRLRGEPNAYNLIDIDKAADSIAVTVREYADGRWLTREATPEQKMPADPMAA
jgi:3',5'-cyclic AMP phosphodiesterase CpdA